MKSIVLLTSAVLALSACAATPPVTAWGKKGVSKADFGTDVGMCTGLASQVSSGSGVNTAGGVSGRNNSSSAGSATAGANSGTVSSGNYQGMASGDYATRAATQQRAQEMAAKRAQTDAYRGCLTERGYTEFNLTPEQAAKLASLKAGTNEYYEYLYELGVNPPASASK